MAKAWSKKDQRQYEHVKDSAEDQGRPARVAKRIAAATVNKQRSGEGRTKKSKKKSAKKTSKKTGNRSSKKASGPKTSTRSKKAASRGGPSRGGRKKTSKRSKR